MSKKRANTKLDLHSEHGDGPKNRITAVGSSACGESGHKSQHASQSTNIDVLHARNGNAGYSDDYVGCGESSGLKQGINLFKNNSMAKANYKLSYMDTGSDMLEFGFDEIETIENTYGFCLLGYVIGGKPPTAALFDLIKRWGSNITFQTHVSGWILFSFPTADVRDRIFNSGNHMVFGFHLFLKEVPRCFRFGVEDMSLVPVWIQMHGLPPDCWTSGILSKIASRIGNPIHMDSFTYDRKRLKFARVLVEVDAGQGRIEELKVRLPIGIVDISIVYEHNITVCDICKRPGHTKEKCFCNARNPATNYMHK